VDELKALALTDLKIGMQVLASADRQFRSTRVVLGGFTQSPL